MAQKNALIKILQQALKSKGLTYADVAKGLNMSEANIKRMFSAKRFTLDRLEDVCQLMHMELSDLFQLYEESRQRIAQLTEEQEEQLVGDLKLLLVAVCVRNRMIFDEIIETYALSDTECIRYLAKLDKLQLIDLLPHNRIKLRIADDFRWLPNGPIERFFEKQIQGHFMRAGFNGAGQCRLFLTGPLSDRSHQMLMNKVRALANEFAELHRQDSGLARDKRQNIGLLIALRPWEFEAFQSLQRAK